MGTLVIAEAGVNHNGDPEIARKLIDVAAEAAADVVKFQTALPDEVITRHARKARYQVQQTGDGESQLEMIKRLHFGDDRLKVFRELADHARRRDIRFLSTPFDLPSLRLLTDSLGLRLIKLPSGELTNAALLLAAARTGSDIILSTGMGTLPEIEEALGVLAFGYLAGSTQPCRSAFAEAFRSEEGRAILHGKVTLLHCVTAYPAPLDDVNILAMDTMREHFMLPVGYSDHTLGLSASLAAVARGATVIEKHFTLDRNLPGPDHAASLEPQELRQLVTGIREIERVLGLPEKRVAPSELSNMTVARRSLVARTPIRASELFTESNLTAKRPGTGISPMNFFDMIGRVAHRDYNADDLIERE